MGHVDHRPVPPLEPPAHPELLSGERLWIDTGGLEGVAVLALDQHGEILPPILVEVEIDASRRFADLRHHAFDQLVAAGEAPEALDIVGGKHAVGPRPPNPLALCPRLGLAGEQLAYAGMVVGEGIDPGEPLADKLALQPDAFAAFTT